MTLSRAELHLVRTAAHEAGHVVALTHFGVPVFGAWIRHPITGTGAVQYSHAPVRGHPLKFVVAALAGGVAAAAISGRHPLEELETGGASDLDKIFNAADGITEHALAACLARAEQIVLRKDLQAWHAIAEALLREPDHHLNGARISTILDDHRPDGIGYRLRQLTTEVETREAGSP